MVRSKKSEVWLNFIKTRQGGQCKLCNKEVKTAGNTTNLRNHLKRRHSSQGSISNEVIDIDIAAETAIEPGSFSDSSDQGSSSSRKRQLKTPTPTPTTALFSPSDSVHVQRQSRQSRIDASFSEITSFQEHVWQVTLLNRGLGTNRIGPYRLCLTDKTLTLIKKDENCVLDLQLTNIRSCGSLRNYFFLEVGRSSHLGAGELWMDSDDPNIAQNIHTTIFHAMTTNTKKEELEPRSRVRSSSATESSKPNNAVNRTRQGTSGVQRTHVFSQDNPNTSTNNEPQIQVPPVSNNTVTAAAPHSTGGGATWSGNICHQRTQSLPLTAHPTTNAPLTDNTPLHPSSTRAPTTTAKRSNQSSKCIMGGRERCDSMPSRPRTTSEGPHPITTWRFTTSHHRSHGRDISHSPPSGSPVSPPSVGCSTDSTGSSYSLADEVDVCNECPEPMRYSVPLTPDEAIAEEDCPESPCGIYESYVPMAPPSSDDGYVDMSPRCPHNATSPTASMSSVTSGTPSTDIRFSDYPLDKVSSYLALEDDDARPARAYSVGSRPETCRSKRHVELAGTPENSRVRAFSVGSKTKKGPFRVLPPHYPHAGAKSSSAPLLSNYRTHSSHSSIGPMDDLMEMDFSRSNTGSSTNSGYMEMKPGVAKTPSGYVEMKPGVDLRTNSTSDVSPYVDMSGSSPARNHITSPHEEYNSFVDMRQYHRLSSHEQARNNNYMDMDQRKYRTHSSSSNTRVSTSPSSYPWSDYMDMSGNQPKRSERGSFSSQLSSSPNVVSVSPKNGDYSLLNLYSQDLTKSSEKEAKTPEGYVEMTPGSVKHQRQSSLDNTQVNRGNEDYTNMSLGLGAAKKKVVAKKEKARSQPISINSTTASFQVTKNSSSPISVSSLLGRKSSTGTPPRMHLPISSWSTSPYSSLPRQKPRKDSNSNSKDSSSSSVTTPSSSSTIFPMSLNSPSSPMKPTSKAETPSALKLPAALLNAIYKNNNKSSVGKPAADDYTVMDFETNKSKPVKMDDSPSDYVNYSPAAKTPTVIPSKVEVMDETPGDYTLMKPGVVETRTMNLPLLNTSPCGNTSPLVNDLSSFGINETQAKCFRPIKEDVRLGSSSPRPGDVVPTKLSEDSRTTGTATTEGVESPYEMWRSTECVSPAAKISRPNSVNSDAINNSPRPSLGSTEKSRPSSVASDTSKGAASRPSSTSSELCSSSSTLIGSRPESVNSDQIRPDSAAGQPVTVKTDIQLHYARLDLAQAEEDGSRSPRTTKGSPSDAQSQTQCEPAFFYAEIDFKKSEGLKHSGQSLPSNAKVQH